MTAIMVLVGVVVLGMLCYGLVTGKPLFKWQWEADWEGHHIVVRQWFNSRLRGGEELVIDEILAPKERPSQLRAGEDLYGEINHRGEVHKVHAQIYSTWVGLRCRLRVGKELITASRQPFDKKL